MKGAVLQWLMSIATIVDIHTHNSTTHSGAVSSPMMITSESLDASPSVASWGNASLCFLVGELSYVEGESAGDLTGSFSNIALPTNINIY